ncbi:MAG: 30S ribosomal protein S21 [Phycisphaeraceae bacterium]|nr:30S ribosomal protein S21 [Phycisphaeraceae bacterium]
MAIRVKARGGESTDQMLRRFKKLCEKEGLTKDIKRKEYYEKPSERRRRDMRKGIARRIREALGDLAPQRESRKSRG